MIDEQKFSTRYLRRFFDDAAWRFALKYGGQNSIEIEDADIFSNFRRRKLTDLLVEQRSFGNHETSTVDITEASSTIAAQENGKTPEDINSNERKRVYVALYQNHVPFMEEKGWVSYDDERKEVIPEDTILEKFRGLEEVRKYLEFSQDEKSEAEEREPSGLDLDGFYKVLENPRRRYVIGHLKNCGASDLSSTAEFAAAAETGKPQRLLTSSERKKVLISLHQHHLPKMEEYSVVDYGKNSRKNVDKGENFETVASYVEDDIGYTGENEDFGYSGVLHDSLIQAVNSFKD